MANPRRRAINKKPENNWRETSAAALKQTRETLGAQIQEKMSEYTNRHLWKNARTATPAVVDNSDPQDIKDLKNCLLLLLYIENTIRLGRNIFRMPLFGIYNSLTNLPSIADRSNSIWKEITRIISLTKAGKYKLADIQALANIVTDRVKTLINYRNPPPNNPAFSFNVPPQPSTEWWAENPAPLPSGGHLVNFEYDYLMNPIRKLLAGLDAIFPDLALNKIPFIDRGFLPVPDIEYSKIYFQQQNTLQLSLKALYNLVWSVNRMGRGLLAHGKIQAAMDLKDFGIGALENMQLLDFSVNITQEIYTRLMAHYKEYLITLKNTFLNFTPSDLAAIQQYEIDHHLKPGAISGVLKLVFDRLEDFYLENNIYFNNPFNSPKNTVALISQLQNNAVATERSRLVTLRQHCETLEAQLTTLFLHRAVSGSTATRDKFIIRVLESLTRLLIAEKPQDLDKANMHDIQIAVFNELSTTGRRELLQTLAERAAPEEQALGARLSAASEASPPSSFQWLAAMGTVLNTYTPAIISSFVTSFFSPFLMPSALAGNTLRVAKMQYDLHLIFALPANHTLADTFVITQEAGELIYIDSNGRNIPLLNESEIEQHAPFLKDYIELNTEPLPIADVNRPDNDDVAEEKKGHNDASNPLRAAAAIPAPNVVAEKSLSINGKLSHAQLTILDKLIAAKKGPQHAFLPSDGILAFLTKTTIACCEKIRDIDRTQEELTQGINQADNDLAHAKFRATLRLLEPRDLLRMINAVRHTEDEPMLNLDIKSRLAALVADIQGENRERYVIDAHRVATKLVRDPRRIIALIERIFSDVRSTLDDKILCRELMTQLALLDNIRIELLPEQILRFASREVHRDTQMAKRCISALLTQFNTATLSDESDWSIIRSNHTPAVLNLIIRQQVITVEAVEAELLIYSGINRKSYTLTLLFDLYQRSHDDPVLQKQVGIFMTNIALHDMDFSQLIFSANHDSEFLMALKKSCLGSDKKNSTLYYEAWVNSLEIGYSSSGPNLSLDEIVHNNGAIILDIYKVLNPTAATPSLVGLLAQPWELCKMIGDFITGFLSQNSKAEEKIRKLFLSMVYGTGPKCATIRKELTQQYYEKGISDASYYQFLVPKYTVGELADNFNIFWINAKKDLIYKISEMIDSLSATKKLFKLSEKESRSPLVEEFDNKIVAMCKLRIQLIDKNSKLDTACYQTLRNFTLYQEEVMQIISKIQASSADRLQSQSPPSLRSATRPLGTGIFQRSDASSSSGSNASSSASNSSASPPKRNPSGN
jgi:hypothetical protein